MRALANGAANGAVSAVGQAARNFTDDDINTSCSTNMDKAALFGLATGVGGSLVGDAFEYGVNGARAAIAAQAFRSAALEQKLFATSNAIQAPAQKGWGTMIGTVAGSQISNWPNNPLIKPSDIKK